MISNAKITPSVIGNVDDDNGTLFFISVYKSMVITGGENNQLDIMDVDQLKKIRQPIQLPDVGRCSLILGHTLVIAGEWYINIY